MSIKEPPRSHSALKASRHWVSGMVFVAVDGLVLTVGMVLFVAALMGVSAAVSENLDDILIYLGMDIPRFDYGRDGMETGNALFEVYAQLRWACLVMIFIVVIIVTSLRGIQGNVLYQATLMVILLLVFPPIWDALAVGAGDLALWMLNPAYTFDPDNPCPDRWDRDTIESLYQSIPYTAGVPVDDIDMVCSPSLRVSYLIRQAAGPTTLHDADTGDMLQVIHDIIPAGLQDIFVNIFAQVLKAIMMLNLALAAAVAGVIFDLFVGLVIGSLPVMLCISSLPRFANISSRFLSTIPGILLAPILTSIILVAGSGAVASAAHTGLVAVWISASAVLFMASTLPILLVPVISGVIHHATGTISGGITASVQVVSVSIQGASSGDTARGVALGGLEGLAKGHLRAYGAR